MKPKLLLQRNYRSYRVIYKDPFLECLEWAIQALHALMNFEALPKLWPPHVINIKEVPLS